MCKKLFKLSANRAKSIKTDARVNQEATNKIIQELIAEKERLLKELESAKHGYGPDITKEGQFCINVNMLY